LLPPTRPASQAGILHGRNDGIPGFRWYEKEAPRLFVPTTRTTRPRSSAESATARDCSPDGGASIGNLVTGMRHAAPDHGHDRPGGVDRRRTAPARPLRHHRRLHRLLVLMAGRKTKDCIRRSASAPSVEPRMHRDLAFAVERAVTNVALRTVSTALVIEEMHCSAPDQSSGLHGLRCHPSLRPERVEAIRCARRHRSGHRLAVERLLATPAGPIGLSCSRTTVSASGHVPSALRNRSRRRSPPCCRRDYRRGQRDAVESAGVGRRIAPSSPRLAAWDRCWQVGCAVPWAVRIDAAAAPPDVVVCSSGSLAHVYFHR